MTGFDTEHWSNDFERIANGFYNDGKSRVGGEFLSINTQEIVSVRKKYELYKEIMKKEIYGDERSQNRIDRHKITALYVQAFLESNILKFEMPPAVSANEKLCFYNKAIVEFYCIAIIETILASFSEKADELFYIDYKHTIDLVVLFDQFRFDTALHNKVSVFTYSLAHIIYHIDRIYFQN